MDMETLQRIEAVENCREAFSYVRAVYIAEARKEPEDSPRYLKLRESSIRITQGMWDVFKTASVDELRRMEEHAFAVANAYDAGQGLPDTYSFLPE